MRSTHRLPTGLAVAVSTLALAACSSAQGGEANDADAPVIRLADGYPLTHPFAEYGVSVFIDRLESEGFEVEYFPAGQMGTPQDLAILARTGVIDVAPASAAYLEDQLPLSSVSDLPDMTTDACVAGRSMMELLSEDGILYDEEYEPFGVRPLWISIIPNYEILTADRPVVDPEDAQGLILRSSGGAFDVTMDQAGVAAVSMPAGDTYEAMSRGTVDGTAMPFLSVVPYRLDEVSQYSTDGLNMGSVGIPYVISEDAWQTLTPAQRDVVTDAGHEANESLCVALDRLHDEGRDYMRDNGVQLTALDEDQRAAWAEALGPVRQDWATSLDNIGLPGSEVLAEYEEAIARHEADR